MRAERRWAAPQIIKSGRPGPIKTKDQQSLQKRLEAMRKTKTQESANLDPSKEGEFQDIKIAADESLKPGEIEVRAGIKNKIIAKSEQRNYILTASAAIPFGLYGTGVAIDPNPFGIYLAPKPMEKPPAKVLPEPEFGKQSKRKFRYNEE